MRPGRGVNSRKKDTGVARVEGMGVRSPETTDVPGVILPEQWFESASRQSSRLLRLSPVQSLMLAVLEDAISCYADLEDTRPSRQRAARQAGDWLRSHDNRWLFAFESVCEHLDLEPASVRRRVFAAEIGATTERRRSTRRVLARRGGPGTQRAAPAGRVEAGVGAHGSESIRKLEGAV